YMRILGSLLIVLGLAGSWTAWQGANADEVYFRALKGLEKYPGNILYHTEFKMAEPRHMLLLGGAWASAPGGVVLGSICLGVASILASGKRQSP
ncbi:MAG: hypothetical protein ACI91F_003294, partial [Candidatus Binatia bacterium]